MRALQKFGEPFAIPKDGVGVGGGEEGVGGRGGEKEEEEGEHFLQEVGVYKVVNPVESSVPKILDDT